MSFLTRDQIVDAQDRKYVDVEVPEWKGKVRLASLDADQSLKQEALLRRRQAGDANVNPLTSILAASIVGEDGNQLFTEKDLAALGKKSPAVLLRLASEVKKLNKLDQEDVTGNSEANPSED